MKNDVLIQGQKVRVIGTLFIDSDNHGRLSNELFSESISLTGCILIVLKNNNKNYGIVKIGPYCDISKAAFEKTGSHFFTMSNVWYGPKASRKLIEPFESSSDPLLSHLKNIIKNS